MSRVSLLLACATFLLIGGVVRAEAPNPPPGFRALFNGKDLTGWHGLNPHDVVKLTPEKKEESLAQQRANFSKYWSVENGELVNLGEGPYANTDEEFGDLELLIEYKTVPKADSGVYLRGVPQVQIWDWNQVFDPKNPTRLPHLGSGGLFNNTPGTTGRDPLVFADRPFGEWNQFRIRQVQDRTWVWLNDQAVVEAAVMENYYDRSQPFPVKGPIMLQTHGGEIRWRNLYVREIGSDEASAVLSNLERTTRDRLSKGLTLHAGFDTAFTADFSRGDATCYVQQGKELVAAQPTDEVRLVTDAGRFGGALLFTKKGNVRPTFKDDHVLDYNARNWSSSVSVWLRLNPDQDLEPGYCDPVQIVGDDLKKGFIFLEWSKDETPRFFRYAIRPLFEIWNPTNVQWADIPFNQRPMVQVERAPFSRENWTHVVFSVENVNDKTKLQRGRLHMNGKLQGTIDNWDLSFAWDPSKVLLVLGAAYVGYVDDLSVFDHALTDSEVKLLYGLPRGVAELR